MNFEPEECEALYAQEALPLCPDDGNLCLFVFLNYSAIGIIGCCVGKKKRKRESVCVCVRERDRTGKKATRAIDLLRIFKVQSCAFFSSKISIFLPSGVAPSRLFSNPRVLAIFRDVVVVVVVVVCENEEEEKALATEKTKRYFKPPINFILGCSLK